MITRFIIKWGIIFFVLLVISRVNTSLYVLLLVIIILYIFYRLFFFMRRLFTPKGRRIKHSLLKGHMKQKYGDEGVRVYKDIVSELNKRGYR